MNGAKNFFSLYNKEMAKLTKAKAKKVKEPKVEAETSPPTQEATPVEETEIPEPKPKRKLI